MPNLHDEVRFTRARRQWSVPISIALGVMVMIGFWPAPNSGASSSRSSVLETTTTLRSIVTQEAPPLAPDPLLVADDGESLPSVDVEVDQPQSHEALGIEQLLLGTQPPQADLGGVEEGDLDESAQSPTTGMVDDGETNSQPVEDGDVAQPDAVEEPTGSDVLQVVRWVNSAAALGEPADAETVDGVVQTVRSAWEAQRRAVVAGGSSDEWSHVLASRSGFARVVAAQLMASMSAGSDRAISDAALTVSSVRLDPAGRALANFCVVEDGGFASFGDSQGEWGVVVTVTGVLGLMRNGGGWFVDDVAQRSSAAQC
ncbi:MAG: hypothetical protein VW442_00580 [Acidimicrobiaceae bacterium]